MSHLLRAFLESHDETAKPVIDFVLMLNTIPFFCNMPGRFRFKALVKSGGGYPGEGSAKNTTYFTSLLQSYHTQPV
jgi:hypothetical protein